MYRIAFDIGGTFTDFVLAAKDAPPRFLKLPTTPDDPARAVSLAEQLDTLNLERREVEQAMQTEAEALVDELSHADAFPDVVIVHDQAWHQGVIGLVASRLKERAGRPVIAMAPDPQAGGWKGSARSVPGVHIRDALARLDTLYPGIMTKFGGHAMAAGFSLKSEQLDAFLSKMPPTLSDFVQGHDWQQSTWTDGPLAADEITLELAEELQHVTPWGQGFPEPLFEGEFEINHARWVGEIHLKLALQLDAATTPIDAICFGYGRQHAELPHGRIRCAYRLQVNDYQDNRTVQMIITELDKPNIARAAVDLSL